MWDADLFENEVAVWFGDGVERSCFLRLLFSLSDDGVSDDKVFVVVVYGLLI